MVHVDLSRGRIFNACTDLPLCRRSDSWGLGLPGPARGSALPGTGYVGNSAMAMLFQCFIGCRGEIHPGTQQRCRSRGSSPFLRARPSVAVSQFRMASVLPFSNDATLRNKKETQTLSPTEPLPASASVRLEALEALNPKPRYQVFQLSSNCSTNRPRVEVEVGLRSAGFTNTAVLKSFKAR